MLKLSRTTTRLVSCVPLKLSPDDSILILFLFQGKFVRIFFNSLGAIAGANIDWYLLEKSRVTARSSEERSFHVFFQLLRSGQKDLLSTFSFGCTSLITPKLRFVVSYTEQLLLDDEAGSNGSKAFEYLSQSRQDVDGMDDKQEWNSLIVSRSQLNLVRESTNSQILGSRSVRSKLSASLLKNKHRSSE